MYLATANSTAIRIAFRVIFFVLSVYLGLLGSYCNKFSLKLRLLHDGRIPVQDAAGWVQGTAVLEPLYRTRRIPNWKWWVIMAAVLALVKINDLITNTIHVEHVIGLCPFGTGLVLSKTGFDTFIWPPWNSRSQATAGNAQIFSVLNGCARGIYKKVNVDPTFCAVESDIIGWWDCIPYGKNVTYPYGTLMDAIVQDLNATGYIYQTSYSDSFTRNTASAADFTHFVLWSSNATIAANQSGVPWDVKAVVDVTANENDTKIMHGMYCQLEGQEQVQMIARSIPSIVTLKKWVWLLQGFMYDGYGSAVITDPEVTLAWLLNSMIMVAGGSDTLLATPPPNDAYQGCVLSQTYVPTPVIAFLILTLLSCAAMTTSTLYFYRRLRSHANKSQVEHAPVDRWSWMGQAAAESNAASFGSIYPVRSQDLSLWEIERDSGMTVRLVKGHSEAVLLSAVQPKRDQDEPAVPDGIYARDTSYPGS